MSPHRDLIVERLRSAEPVLRGDHDLNPGYRPDDFEALTPAAVLVPLVERDDGYRVLLTRRTEDLKRHAGQIAFPGGRVDPVDCDAVACALRETEEEIGLDRRHVDIVGELDPYITGSGFRITPIVAFVRTPFELRIDPREVAEAFEVPLVHFLDPANHHRHSGQFRGRERFWYAMPYHDYYIWGATAGMLMNFYHRLKVSA